MFSPRVSTDCASDDIDEDSDRADATKNVELDPELIPSLSKDAKESTRLMFITSIVALAAMITCALILTWLLVWMVAATLVSLGLYFVFKGGRPARLSGMLSITLALIASGLFLFQIFPISIPVVILSILTIGGSYAFTAGAVRKRFLWRNRLQLLREGIDEMQSELADQSESARALVSHIYDHLGRVEEKRRSTDLDNISGMKLTAYVSSQRERLEKVVLSIEELQSNLNGAQPLIELIERWQAQLDYYSQSTKPKNKRDDPRAKLRRLSYEEWSAWQESMPALEAHLKELTDELPVLPTGAAVATYDTPFVDETRRSKTESLSEA